MAVEQFKVVASADIGNLTAGMDKVQSTLAKTAIAAQKTDSSLGRMGTGANQATQAMTNLGRVVQDAPYGFIGIANNINPLLESFQRLKAETGSTKQAIAALGTSLIGAGGLGLAVSIATSLLTVLSVNGFFSSGNAAKDAAEKVKTYGEEVKEISKSLAKEATEVTGFIAVLKSETETRERKLEAIKELQKIQPEVFKNLKLEGDAVIGLDAAYTAYIANLRNIVAVKLIQAKIEGKIAELIELQGEATGKLSKETQDARDKFKKFVETQADGLDPLARANKALLEAKYNAMGFLSEAAKSNKIRTLNDEIKGLVDRLSEFSSAIKTDAIKPDKIDVAPKKLRIIATNGLEVGFDDEEAAARSLTEAIERVMPKGIKSGTSVFGKLDKEALNIISPEAAETIRQNTIKRLHEAGISTTDRTLEGGLKIKIPIEIATQAELDATIVRVNSFATVLAGTFDQLGQHLSDAFSAAAKGGNFFGSLFASLLKSLGAGVTQLGIQVIATSELIVAAKAAIKSGAGISGIGAGIALVALGALISAAANNIKVSSFATGTRNSPGGMALVGERGPEMIYLPGGSAVQPNNELKAYGSWNQPIVLDARLGYDAIYIGAKRGEKQVSANYG
jgi:hypothetical protein